MLVPFLAHRIRGMPAKAKAPIPPEATRPEIEDRALDD
jgi:hypothetical protein